MIVAILSVVSGAAVALAYYKHKTTAAVIASAKKEVTYLETVAEKVATEAKAEYTASVARLKALL